MSVIENSIFKKENLQRIDIGDQLDFGRGEIARVQREAIGTGGCCLSFYPFAKNIRFISSHFYRIIKNGLKPVISAVPRPGEETFWKEKTQDNWYPWLWSRHFEKNASNKESWENIFENIEHLVDWGKDGPVDDFGLYLACLDHTFRIQPKLEKEVLKSFNYDWPEDKVVGLQIRRGEIVPKSGDIEKGWDKRPLYSINQYMDEAARVCSVLETNNIFVSTDSSETIDYLEKYFPDYRFYYNKYDRSKFLRYTGGEANLEIDLRFKPELIKHYVDSCLSDLLGLSYCQGYVGGMSWSEYGICGWFLQMIKQRSITPYVNLEGTLNLNDPKVGMLLI